MRFALLLVSISTLLHCSVIAQCPVSNFILNDTACQGMEVSFSNTSVNGLNYEWDFCTGDLLSPSFDTSSEQLNALLQTPAGVAVISEGAGEFVFVCSRDNGKLLRLEYANGIENPSTGLSDLGNLSGTVGNPNGIAVYKESGTWYVLLTDVFTGRVVLAAFGNGIDQAPTQSQVIINAGLNIPRSIKLARESNDSIFAYVTNFTGNTLSIFTFGTSILNAPVLLNTLSVPNANGLISIDIQRDCDHWYGALCCYFSSDVILADFGTSLSAASATFSYIPNGTQRANDIALVNDGDRFFNLVASGYGLLTLQDLGPVLAGASSVSTLAITAASNSISGIGMFRKASHWYGFTPQEIGNVLSRIDFHNPCELNTYESNDNSPTSIIYLSSDTVEVTLTTLSSSGGVDRSSTRFNVHQMPHTDFSVEGVCLGSPTLFVNTSTAGSSLLSGFLWNFGDGDTSSAVNPTHTFSALGNQHVSLISTTNYGCTAYFDTTFSIEPLPTASFTTGTGCSESRLQLTDNSSVTSGSITGWHWDFGNGIQSTDSVPDYGYPQGGNYTIHLVVTTEAGCKDSTDQPVFIQDRPIGALSVSNTCSGQIVQFNDQSTIAGSTITGRWWSFGDGDTSIALNPSHSFPAGSGNYPLQLIVYAANGCSDTVLQDLRISNIPSSMFTSTPMVVCTGTTVHFDDQSFVVGDTISAWAWNFGDGGFDTLQHPDHTFNLPGQFTISLIAYSPTSCPGNLFTQTINVLPGPQPSFIAADACLGSPMSFFDSSIPGSGDGISSVSWQFGTGDTATAFTTTYIYPSAGTYSVVQTVNTTFGCSASDTQTVNVRSLPIAQFVTNLPCNGQEVIFTNSSYADSTSSLLASTWNFGDPASSNNTSSLFNPIHIFSGLSSYDVSLIVETNFGCKDTVISTVNVLPSSTVNFTYSPTCYGDLMEFFNPGTPLDSFYLWNFGDNQFNQLQEPAHFYAFPGSYNVTLTVYAASGCITTASRLVTVSPIPNAAFVTSPACDATPYTFINQSSITTGSITDYEWLLDGATPFSNQANPTFTFPETGQYNVTLKVTSDIGCTDSYTSSIISHPLPVADFNFSPQFGNPPLAVTFTDQSVGATSYTWDFGDGAVTAVGTPVLHTYQDTGYYTIREIVSSTYGCLDTLTKNIYVIRPLLDIAVIGDSSYKSGDYFHIIARVANLGTRPIDSIALEARLEDGSTIRENYIDFIPNGPEGYKTYAFKAAFLLNGKSAPEYYCIQADSPNGQEDDVPENNLKCFTTSSEPKVVVFPNPLLDELNIDIILEQSESVSIELFDQYGRLTEKILESTLPTGLTRLSKHLTSNASGVYTLRISYRNRFFQRQLIKQ